MTTIKKLCWFCNNDLNGFVSVGLSGICNKCQDIHVKLNLELEKKLREDKKIRRYIKDCEKNGDATGATILRQSLK